MLYYFGEGERDYFSRPVSLYQRAYWEFQIVISGRIAMRLPSEEANGWRSRCLWVSAPGNSHGWAGISGRPAHVLVFHFLTIPEILVRGMPSSGYIECPVSQKQLEHLKGISRYDWRVPSPEMLLRSEHLLLELSLLAIDALEICAAKDEGLPSRRVRAALDVFASQMEVNPRFDEVARIVGCSTAQLRRYFYDVMQMSPKKVFNQLRFQRAMQMMVDPDMKLASVSEACGFGSMSAFSRAFKSQFGINPARWRG